MATEQITIRLPVERVALLRDQARTEHRSIAQQVEHLLDRADALEAQQHAAKQPAQQVTPATRNPPAQPLETPEPQVTPRLKTPQAKRRT
jgi:hypothetical protein